MITVEATLNLLRELARSLESQVEEALDDAVITCLEVSTPRTPVDTGALRGNIDIEASEGERTLIWNQHYAGHQEFGTSRGVPASGFARAGADAGLEAMEASLASWGGA